MGLLKSTMLIWKTTSSSGLTIPNQLNIWIFYISSLLSSLSVELENLLIRYVPLVRTIKSVLLITHHQSLNFQRISFIQTLSLTISISIFVPAGILMVGILINVKVYPISIPSLNPCVFAFKKLIIVIF